MRHIHTQYTTSDYLFLQVQSSELYRDVNRVRNPVPIPNITIFRYHASLNFANMDFFQVKSIYCDVVLCSLSICSYLMNFC